jgi:hypothetical protein
MMERSSSLHFDISQHPSGIFPEEDLLHLAWQEFRAHFGLLSKCQPEYVDADSKQLSPSERSPLCGNDHSFPRRGFMT